MLVISPEIDDGDNLVQPFEPPRITHRTAERIRRLSTARQGVSIAQDWTVRIIPVESAELWAESGRLIEVDFRVNGETASLRTVLPALEAFLYQIDPRIQVSDLDPELCATLIEAASADAIEAIEQRLNMKCSVERVVSHRDHPNLPFIDLSFDVNNAGAQYPGRFYASSNILGVLAALWQKQPRSKGDFPAPNFSLAARVATSEISRIGLRGLVPGDALLFDRVAPNGGVVLCLGERLCALSQITDDGAVRLDGSFSKSNPLLLGEFLMSENDYETEAGAAAALEDVDLRELPVRLVFELGRRDISLDELSKLSVGSPIPLDRPTTSVVDILANGRRVGAGEMVLIGDQLGVRITRLNSNA